MRIRVCVICSLWLVAVSLCLAQPAPNQIRPVSTHDEHQLIAIISSLSIASSAGSIDNLVQKLRIEGYIVSNLKRELYPDGAVKTYAFRLTAPSSARNLDSTAPDALQYSIDKDSKGNIIQVAMDISVHSGSFSKRK